MAASGGTGASARAGGGTVTRERVRTFAGGFLAAGRFAGAAAVRFAGAAAGRFVGVAAVRFAGAAAGRFAGSAAVRFAGLAAGRFAGVPAGRVPAAGRLVAAGLFAAGVRFSLRRWGRVAGNEPITPR